VDDWLVQMVGLLAVAIGAALLVGARREPPSPETLTLAIGAAASFAAIDVIFVLRDRIPPVYLADAAAELLVLGAAVAGWARRRRGG